MSKINREEVVVYWSPNSIANPEFSIDWSLIYRLPEKDEDHHNKFSLKTTVGADYTYDLKSFEFKSNIDAYIGGRNEGDLEGKNLVLNLSVGWLFFSEEFLSMKVENPTEKDAPHVKQGTLVESVYDISSWFKSLEAKFHLKEGQKTFSLEREEPLAVVEFLTDKPVVFKRFELTNQLMYLSNSCSRSSIIFDDKFSQSDLEKIFTETEVNKLVLKNIKNNLV